MNVLVVGGAGYVGSHCVRQLVHAGHRVSVVDSMERGVSSNIPEGVKVYINHCGDYESMRKVLHKEAIEVVMHFAAYAYVEESMRYPLKYYENNVAETIHLLRAMKDEGVKRIIFSSSCAVYGISEVLPIVELTPCSPVNVYGKTKLDVEKILFTLCEREGFRSVIFRYFNAAGASPWGGEVHKDYKRLIPAAFEAALGELGTFPICGVDYQTKDGTCERDFVHVDDIASAHVLGLNKMDATNGCAFYNLGLGRPYSVKDILKGVEKLTGKRVKVEAQSRRIGDPPTLFADSTLAKKELGWQPKYTEIESILETYWHWYRSSHRKASTA